MPQAPETAPTPSELPMRLTRLRVKNFRSIAELDIPLSPLTVLVGPNGSGKSNVVDALRFVHDVFARGLDQAVMDREGMGVIQRWGTEGITIELVAEEQGYVSATRMTYGFKFCDVGAAGIQIENERLFYELHVENFASFEVVKTLRGIYTNFKTRAVDTKPVHKSTTSKGLEVDRLWFPSSLLENGWIISALGEHIERFFETQADYYWELCSSITNGFDGILNHALAYTLNPQDLRQPQRMLKEVPLDEAGRNLAAVLRRLSFIQNVSWDNLCFALRRAVVGFDTLEVEPVGGYLATKLLYHTNDPAKPRASYLGQESDGTIRMLGLLAALYQEPAQPFISIEEPEANIHPGALAVLAGVLDEASLRSQVLVTTHSPDMLDHLPAESFLVVEKVGDATRVGPLDAGQLESVRRRLFTPGELLRMEGLQRQADNDSAE